LKKGIGIILVLWTVAVNAQEKIEVEKRITVGELPVKAIEWFDDAYERARKTRWYYEETSGQKSYEAKLKWKRRMHSVEFDTTGVVQDIEISIEWQDLPETIRQNITSYLDSAFISVHCIHTKAIWEHIDKNAIL
jgi:hypothetical protein